MAVLYTLFDEHFFPEWGGKMAELFERIDIRENGDALFEGNLVARLGGRRAVVSGKDEDVDKLRNAAEAAQEEFDNTPIGQYRDQLEKMDIRDAGPETLNTLYRTRNMGARHGDLLTRELVKSLAKKYAPVIAFAVIALAGVITAIVIGVRNALKRGSKAASSEPTPKPKPRPIPPLPGPTPPSPKPSPPAPRDNPVAKLLEWMSENLFLSTMGGAVILMAITRKR